jgi:hypothetical protein
VATMVRTTARKPATRGMKYVSRQRGKKILDRQARKYLGMSGDEFVRKYRAGEVEDPDRTDVRRVAMLIPLADR